MFLSASRFSVGARRLAFVFSSGIQHGRLHSGRSEGVGGSGAACL